MNEEGTGQEPNMQTGQEPEAKEFSAEYVKKLRAEAAEWRTKAQEASGKVKEFEQEKLTETEKAKAQAEEAKAQLEQLKAEARQARAKAAITARAAKEGVDPDLAGRLIDVEFDDAGKPQGLDAAFAQLLKDHPYLKTGFSSSNTNPQRKAGLTIEEVRKMTTDQINARWDEVQKVLSSQ